MCNGHVGALRDSFQSKIDSLDFLSDEAHIDCDVLCDVDSSDMTPHHWQELGRRIDKKITGIDVPKGIVVIHGTDTLAWTAAALSFMFSGLPCPIVFTGSQRPLEVPRSDARRNLFNALEVALKGPHEVMLVFGDKIFRGCHVSKDSIFQFDAFRSYNMPLMGHIGLDVVISPYKSRKKPYWFDSRIDSAIAVWTLFPGQSADIGRNIINSGVKALIVEGFGAGNVPVIDDSVLRIFEECQSKKIPVVLSSQCRNGLVQPSLYEGGRQALKKGAIFASGMSREAIQVKIMVMLGRKIPYSKFAKEFCRSWTDEIVEPGGIQ